MTPCRRVEVMVATLVAAAALGCYTYTPVENGPPDAGSEVRVTLEGSGFDGGRTERVFQGRVVRFGPDTLVLETRQVTTPGTSLTAPRPSRIRLPASRVTLVERQVISPWRTVAVVGGGAAGGSLFLAALAGEFSQSQGDNLGDENSGEQILVPLFRIPIP